MKGNLLLNTELLWEPENGEIQVRMPDIPQDETALGISCEGQENQALVQIQGCKRLGLCSERHNVVMCQEQIPLTESPRAHAQTGKFHLARLQFYGR